ncbi:hypothetical protein [Alkalicoccus halolimnae]|uniref:Uncharacterized protein n=1 Tax=Alkalicoccus halolimnae TaxID=1667239 RepID=A0A5C7FH28_9BACI|nr:hypothetical protein [Alkalicoccus halolimnae]TXF86617.1 hypothetical protein FTX54_05145 [Alkalicoccus halolimnae]
MLILKDLNKDQKMEYTIALSLIAVSILAGIVVGMNEEWMDRRNFTAGYIAGSLLAALFLFGIYRSIAFIVNAVKKKKNNSDDS